jgi:hypothetical protein
MKRFLPSLALAAVLTTSAAAGDPLTAESRALFSMAKLIRLDDAVLRWREIPWYTDANEGLKAARAEKRPMFLFVSGDEPLGRC